MTEFSQDKTNNKRRTSILRTLGARRLDKNKMVSTSIRKKPKFAGTSSHVETVFRGYLGLLLAATIVKSLGLDLRETPQDRNPFYSRVFKDFWIDIESQAPDPFYVLELVKRLCGPQSTCLECPGRPLCLPIPGTWYYRR